MKTALVHDDLIQSGGAERVAAAMHRLFPQSPFYTSVYSPRTTLPYFQEIDVRTSFLQRTPLAIPRLHKLALPFYPFAFEDFDFTGYDLVLSSASRFAKGILTSPETCHICYCHTPPRFAWRPQDYQSQSRSARLLAPLMRRTISNLRLWDLASAQRVDHFLSNSHYVARRIQKFYGRHADVIPPPVETARFAPAPAHEVGEHFLIVSRLVGYKRVDLAIEACNRLGVELRIIGDGPERAVLGRQAGPTVRFLGKLPDQEVAAQYARCRALIFPGEEDFGLTPIECMASGRPVVAYEAGGALETVSEGTTGVFFGEQTADSLMGALRAMNEIRFQVLALEAHAARYSVNVFEQRLRQFVTEAVTAHHEQKTARRADKSGLRPAPNPIW